ncbi:MAG: ABC transporter permease [Clostridia bacterium]|nr:ABC transporter permease [Clostridia bacterium]
MNIYLQELRAYRRFTIIWTVSLVGLVLLYLSMYPAIGKDAESFIKVLEGYPKEVREALGMHLESITSLLGFYSFTFTMITLFGAIQAMIIGTGIVSKEVRERTADFLMTKPVSRTRIMTEKLLAAASTIVFTNVIFLTTASIMANTVKTTEFDGGVFFMMTVTLFFVQLMFLAMGVMLSVILPKMKSVLPISLGVVFGFFAIAAFGATSGDEPMRYLTPLKYFDTAYIMKNGQFETPFVVTGVLVVATAITISYFVYKKKNIHAV